jgi:hypothetical protein
MPNKKKLAGKDKPTSAAHRASRQLIILATNMKLERIKTIKDAPNNTPEDQNVLAC